jgi:tellurium resistance protein TerZ
MTINLSKGQTISLAKTDGSAGLTKVRMGLGWDAAKKKGGFFGFGGGAADVDLDASVIVFDRDKKMLDAVWFVHLRGMGGAIQHSGDNRTGDGDGDDESITVDLTALPDTATDLVFTVNSFTGQTFNAVENATCRLVDAKAETEISRYTLSEKGNHTGVVMARVSRTANGWEMTAIGETTTARTVKDMVPLIVSKHL